LPGVLQALPFLIANARRVLGTAGAPDPSLDLAGKRVVVLGGGDTAMDCVRTAVRLGAANVSCVYRRDEASMPGSRREVKNAKDEGVRFVFNRQPLQIEGRQAVASVRVAATQTATPATDSTTSTTVSAEHLILADVVILAFGFRASPEAWLGDHRIAINEQGRVRVDGGLDYQTSNPKVFAGGDNVRGADLVVTAVRDGRDAGIAIARYLAGK
jgi:glutamate synthase (NADPH/NADH) small chain